MDREKVGLVETYSEPHRHPRMLLLKHEIQSVTGVYGIGVGTIIDTEHGQIDTVHLHLTSEGTTPPRARSIPLEWRLCSIAEKPKLSQISPSINLHIDDTLDPACARSWLRLDSTIMEIDVDIIETGSSSYAGNTPILETDVLLRKRVVCIGLGSGGSAIADLLARSGVGEFVLWDHDRLEAHNISRHVCTIRDLGRKKVRAVKDHILTINPEAQVRTISRDVMEQVSGDYALANVVDDADCVVVGTDNNASRFAINEAAVRTGTPAYYGRVYTRACGGDVIQVLPCRDMPCYACHTGVRVVSEEVSSSRDATRIAYTDRPVPTEPGLIVDIQPFANLIARLVVLQLCSDANSSLEQTACELDAPLFLWANRREETFASWLPMKRSYRNMSILRWYAVSVSRNPDCATCGAFVPA